MAVYNVHVDPVNGPITTVGAGITGVIASGINEGDVGLVTIASGTYEETPTVDSQSGIISLLGTANLYLSGVYSVSSGAMQLDNINTYNVTVTGSGDLDVKNCYMTTATVSDSHSVSFHDVNISGALTISDSSYVNFNNCNASGSSSSLTVSDALELNISSGDYSNGTLKVLAQRVSGVVVDRIKGYGYTGTPWQIEGSYNFTFVHCSFVRVSSGVILYGSGSAVYPTSGSLEYTIVAASGIFPVSGFDSPTILASGSCISDYENLGAAQSYIVSGYYTTLDPGFTDPSTGDLRLNANSVCACAADLIDAALDASGQISSTTLNEEAIQFYVKDQEYKATRPSGVYVVQGGKAVYLTADVNLEDHMDVVINAQYVIDAEVKTVASLSDTIDRNSHLYARDYKLVPRMDYKSNREEYYVLPYTMIPLQDMLVTITDEIDDVTISGQYETLGFTRDHQIVSPNGEPHYWIADKTNNYIMKYSSIDNQLMNTYFLQKSINPTGSFGTVQLNDVNVISSNRYGAVIRSEKVYVDEHFETRDITVNNSDGYFKLIRV